VLGDDGYGSGEDCATTMVVEGHEQWRWKVLDCESGSGGGGGRCQVATVEGVGIVNDVKQWQ